MTIIEDISSGGAWFKAEQLRDRVAFLIEVREFERQRPSTYGPKDTVFADVTVFDTEASVQALTPSEELTRVGIQGTALVPPLEKLVGKGTVVRLDTVPSKRAGAKDAWVWRAVSPEIKAKIVEYATKRDEALQAAVAAAPGFDD